MLPLIVKGYFKIEIKFFMELHMKSEVCLKHFVHDYITAVITNNNDNNINGKDNNNTNISATFTVDTTNTNFMTITSTDTCRY